MSRFFTGMFGGNEPAGEYKALLGQEKDQSKQPRTQQLKPIKQAADKLANAGSSELFGGAKKPQARSKPADRASRLEEMQEGLLGPN